MNKHKTISWLIAMIVLLIPLGILLEYDDPIKAILVMALLIIAIVYSDVTMTLKIGLIISLIISFLVFWYLKAARFI